LQTEAVAYVTQRTELLASSAILTTLHCALKAFERPHDRRLALLAGLIVAIGSGCKETLIVAPVLALCLDLAFFSGSMRAALSKHRSIYLSMLLGLLPIFALLLSAPRGETAGFGLGVSVLDNLALQGQAIVWYLRLLAWPDHLSVTYNWHVDHALARYWPADLGLAVVFVLTVWLSLRGKRVALIGWFFFISLAPSSSLVPVINEMVAERRMYLASAPVLTLATLAIVSSIESAPPSLRRAAFVSCAALCVAYAARSGSRVADYRSELALFGSALAVAPDNPQAMWGLASAYEKLGDVDRAVALYEHMAERPYPYVGPASWGTRGLMARADLESRLGRREAAAATMRRALTHDPSSAITRLQLAAAAAQSGDPARARRELYSLLEQPFLHDRIQLELGLIELHLGEEASAKAHLAEALRRAPNNERMKERIAAAARGATH
jgi:tetratricopeptide (TPR) repeat protein